MNYVLFSTVGLPRGMEWAPPVVHFWTDGWEGPAGLSLSWWSVSAFCWDVDGCMNGMKIYKNLISTYVFGWFLGQQLVTVPYMEHIWECKYDTLRAFGFSQAAGNCGAKSLHLESSTAQRFLQPVWRLDDMPFIVNSRTPFFKRWSCVWNSFFHMVRSVNFQHFLICSWFYLRYNNPSALLKKTAEATPTGCQIS